ncbi:Methyltransferase domain-containing protein [Clostridium acidisoli DSM 12555]|uniref:Methyltransferase domain-containing protein n=2 Tax=Clostridium TaxID=1485 RepID=A0A1W1X451_9CLOT|nr:Methyltransferase domain-containing protein [Clostridium acidisoli DSM 12555]
MSMIQDSSTICWNKAGKELCEIVETNDFRMYFIMPYTLQQLGDVSDKVILDLGCGEGGYSRALAHNGANVTSIDCAIDPINYAIKKAKEEGLKIEHFVRNSNDLYDIQDNIFDIVLCSMMLMDIEDIEGTLKEIYRVIKPKGKVFISILHPCFKPKESKWTIEDETIKVIVDDYFNPTEWVGEIKGINAAIIYRHRTLSDYIKAFNKIGFKLTDMNEPLPSEKQINLSPRISWLSKVPMFLFMELEK